MDLTEGAGLAFRGEWKPFPSVHRSGRPKSAGALLGKPLAQNPAFFRGAETKFDAQISGKHVYPRESEPETFPSNGRHSFVESRNVRVTSDSSNALRSYSDLATVSRPCSIESSPATKASHIIKNRAASRLHSIKASTSNSAIDEAKAQKYKMQNMSALIYHSVQQGCAFVPRASATSKSASQKQSSLTTEVTCRADSETFSIVQDKDAVTTAGELASSKRRSNQESSSELVATICEIRADLRTNDQLSVLMKQIQSIAFLSKLPQETLRELCRVMKVQSYYRKDRVFIQGDVGEHFFIILEGKCVVYKELSMQQARDMQLDLSGNDPTVSVTTVANKDWNLGVMTALRAKGASIKILEKVKSREKNVIVKKIVDIKQKLQRLGDSEDLAVRKYTEALRNELADLTQYLENVLVKLGKFSGAVLQTQVEETIEEALKASESAEGIPKQANDVFDAHEISTSASMHEVTNDLPKNLPSEATIATSPTKPVAEHAASQDASTPTYANTEFLAADTKLVIKKLVELSVGAAFGEIALENANSKRTATIVAETDCKLITITRADYRNVLADIFAKKKASDVAFLKEVPIFSKLNPRTVEALQSVMTHQTHRADQVILEAESETSDFYIVLSGVVRVVMRFAFEETGSKSIHESDAYILTPKVRCPTELTICKLGRQNTFGDFYHGRKARSPVAFVADSSEVVVLRLALLDFQHYLGVDPSISSQLMNFARHKSEFYLAQCKAMLKTKGSTYQLASARQTVSSSMIPYPSEDELMALISDKPKPPRIKTNMAAWTRLFPSKHKNPNMPSYWRHDAWREMFEKKQHDIAAALYKIDEFEGATVVGTHVLFPVRESKSNGSPSASPKQRPATATLRASEAKRGEEHVGRPTEYSVKNRTLNLQSWDMPDEHHVNVSNRLDSSDFGKKKFYYAFDPDEPDADYLEDLDLHKMDGTQ